MDGFAIKSSIKELSKVYRLNWKRGTIEMRRTIPWMRAWLASILVSTAALLAAGTDHAAASTVRAVMTASVRVLDPILSTAYAARNHGYMVYDTLLALDEKFEIRPQMLKDWSISADQLTYTFTLREGLKWHNGKPVTSEDCVASLKRWAQRDVMGMRLAEKIRSYQVLDDKRFAILLREPYGLVLQSLAKPSSLVPFMMPKELAETPPDRAISAQIGSGPFKFAADEFQPGVKAVYLKNTDYVPRDEPASRFAGGKVVHVDRVEWISMPDTQMSVSALTNDEVDFLEYLPVDLLPLVEGKDDMTIGQLDPVGTQIALRMNFLKPPFNDPQIRKAALLAMNQQAFLDALIGNPKYAKVCPAMFMCGTPLESAVGFAAGDMAQAKKLLSESKYDGTPVVILQAVDVATLKTHPIVAASLLRQAGFNVRIDAMDWQTMTTRRTLKTDVASGGWSIFASNWQSLDMLDPMVNLLTISAGEKGAWFGWPDDSQIEALRNAYAVANGLAERKSIAEAIQKKAYEDVLYIPLGQYVQPSAWRTSLSGVLQAGVPLFWNISKQ